MRSDYLSQANTPFLWRCSQEGEYYKNVIPGHGFCERTEILTGLSPADSGFFTAIGFAPGESPYRNCKGLRLLSSLERALVPVAKLTLRRRAGKAVRMFRRLCNRFFARQGITLRSYQIPFDFLPHFALTEDARDHREAGAFCRPSILDLLKEDGRGFLYESFTALGMPSPHNDEDRMTIALQKATDQHIDFYPIYIAAPDAQGHTHGPGSEEIKKTMHDMDHRLQRFVDDFTTCRPDTRFVFLGDHGMLQVERPFDAERDLLSIATQLGAKPGRDFVYFLDSTCVRIWALKTEGAERLLKEIASSSAFLQHGKFISKEDANGTGIPFPDRTYGDVLWIADPGVLVYPDFFHRYRAPRGMHGYAPRAPGGQGTCIVWGKGVSPREEPEIMLTGLFDILKRELSLEHK